MADVVTKLNQLEDGWHEMTAGEGGGEQADREKEGGREGREEGEGGGEDGEAGGRGGEGEAGGKEEKTEEREFCLSVEERVDYRQHEAHERWLTAEERRKEREEEARRREEEEERKKAEEPTEEEREVFEAGLALIEGAAEGGVGTTGAPWVAY